MRKGHTTSAGQMHIYTDHSSLMYILDPFGSNTGIGTPVAYKLMRWAIHLSKYQYVVEHVQGDQKVWAYMLTRPAARPAVHIKAKVAALYAPLRKGGTEFDCMKRWQMETEQRKEERPGWARKVDGFWCNRSGRTWTPDSAT